MNLGLFLVTNRKKTAKIIATAVTLVVAMFFLLFSNTGSLDYGSDSFDGEFTEGLPIFSEIKGRGQISDEVAQFAVGVGVKYKILPSLAIGQWAFESAWGTSWSSINENNFFGITWYTGAPFLPGSARGVGGSEGGYYMKFPSKKESFNYYGFMLASQSNFNQVVGVKDLGKDLDIINAGGYAASGTGKGSSYYDNVMAIYQRNNLKELDDFAIKKWNSKSSSGSLGTGKGNVSILESQMGRTLYNGECYGLTAYYVDQLGGPKLMGSGFQNACDIGTDYDWSKYGWQVKLNPSYSEIKEGDIVNFTAGNGFAIPFGHTGVAKSSTKTSVTVYDQWQGHGTTISTYNRPLASIVRKVK